MAEKEDICQRCGEESPDCRTLWMACLYQMSELGLPFEEVQIMGRYSKKTGEQQFPNSSHRHVVFAAPDETQEPHGYRFYTLRVCKDCRGSWLAVIQKWFNEKKSDLEILANTARGSGIWVRENGATIEISREEWDRRNPGQAAAVAKVPAPPAEAVSLCRCGGIKRQSDSLCGNCALARAAETLDMVEKSLVRYKRLKTAAVALVRVSPLPQTDSYTEVVYYICGVCGSESPKHTPGCQLVALNDALRE